jgi:hypothetical protein
MSVKISFRADDRLTNLIETLAKSFNTNDSTIIKAMTERSLEIFINNSENLMKGSTLSIKSEPIRDRKRKAYTYSNSVLNLISDNYYKLRAFCGVTKSDNYIGRTEEDIFEDTILIVSSDEESSKMSEKELMDFFKYRYNMVKFRNAQNYKMRMEIPFSEMGRASIGI